MSLVAVVKFGVDEKIHKGDVSLRQGIYRKSYPLLQ